MVHLHKTLKPQTLNLVPPRGHGGPVCVLGEEVAEDSQKS